MRLDSSRGKTDGAAVSRSPSEKSLKKKKRKKEKEKHREMEKHKIPDNKMLRRKSTRSVILRRPKIAKHDLALPLFTFEPVELARYYDASHRTPTELLFLPTDFPPLLSALSLSLLNSLEFSNSYAC
jgi:hypothetical protein